MRIQEDNRQAIDEVPFSVRARVAMQLGRESISDSITAILELVKNAYDADAENVHIYFVDLRKDSETGNGAEIDGSPADHAPYLILEDDGVGMNEAQLKSSWMVIGIDNKATSRRSGKNRTFIGEKGLGRLGLDRLCRVSSVQTFCETEETGTELIVHWGKYEEAKIRLEQVKHKIYRLPHKSLVDPITRLVQPKPHGTRLVLQQLQDIWDAENLKALQQQLSLLVSPFAGLNDFKIWLHVNQSTEEVVSQGILEASEWLLDSTLEEVKDSRGVTDWYVRYKMVARDGTKFEYNAPWKRTFTTHKRGKPECGQLTFKMYFLPRKEIEELDVDLSQIRTFMDTNQGIRIYRDNFRVKPYGEPTGQGDWLNLSYYRQQHPTSRGKRGWRVGYNQVFGAVFIERERNTGLLDQTNREGLVEGPAYDDLVLFTRGAIDWFEEKDYQYVRATQKATKVEQAKEQARTSSMAANEAVAEFESAFQGVLFHLETSDSAAQPDATRMRRTMADAFVRLRETVDEAKTAQEEIGRLYEERTQELEKEKDTLANLASLGILSVTFGHETLGYSNLVATNASSLTRTLSLTLSAYAPTTADEIRLFLNDIEYGAQRIQTFADFTLKYVRRDRRREVKVYLSKLVNEVLDTFSNSLEGKRNITVFREIQEIEPTRAFYIDWESILINFITNSVWALENTPGDDRVIRVKLYRKDDYIHLLFTDSGCGIAKDTVDKIFEPTYTTKRDRRGRKIGTGMGLFIVENLVRSYGGSIRAESPSDLGGAEFHVQVPFRGDRRGDQ